MENKSLINSICERIFSIEDDIKSWYGLIEDQTDDSGIDFLIDNVYLKYQALYDSAFQLQRTIK